MKWRRGGLVPVLAGALAMHAAAAAPDGAALFAQHCQACHQPQGEGTPGLAPPLAGVLARRAAAPEGVPLLAAIVVHGLSGPISSQGERYAGNMPSFAALSDDDIAAVLTQVLGAWNGRGEAVLPAQVSGARAAATHAQLRERRQRLLAQTGE